jgi:hypothetical protein
MAKEDSNLQSTPKRGEEIAKVINWCFDCRIT